MRELIITISFNVIIAIIKRSLLITFIIDLNLFTYVLYVCIFLHNSIGTFALKKSLGILVYKCIVLCRAYELHGV